MEEQHFTTALTLMAEVETEQSLKMRVNPSGIHQTGRRQAPVSGNTFKIKAAHREETTGALLAWRATMEPESTQGGCNANSFPSSSVVARIGGTSHLHGGMKPKKGQKTSRVLCRVRGNPEHSKNSPHKAPQGLASSSTWGGADIIPKDFCADQPSVCSIPALQEPALCYRGSNKPRYSRVCWMKKPTLSAGKFQSAIHTVSYLNISVDCGLEG